MEMALGMHRGGREEQEEEQEEERHGRTVTRTEQRAWPGKPRTVKGNVDGLHAVPLSTILSPISSMRWRKKYGGSQGPGAVSAGEEPRQGRLP